MARPLPARPLPTRTCVACRTARLKRDLVRVVRAPDGSVAIDPSGRAVGRGAYLCRDRACWDAAGRKRALEHALGTALPDDVAGILADGPDALPADLTDPARASRPRPRANPDPNIQGEARGQE